MSSAKGKNFNCEECGKPTYTSDIGNYQAKYLERPARNRKKTHYFCSDKCKSEWINKHITISCHTGTCPYYKEVKRDNAMLRAVTINCASPIKEARTIRNVFQSRPQRQNQIERYCAGKWQDCPIAKMITNSEEAE